MAIVPLDPGGEDRGGFPLECKECRGKDFQAYSGGDWGKYNKTAVCTRCNTPSNFEMDGTPVDVAQWRKEIELSTWEKRVRLLMEDDVPEEPKGEVSPLLADYYGEEAARLLPCPLCNKPAKDGFMDNTDSTYYISCSDDDCLFSGSSVVFFNPKSWNAVAKRARSRFESNRVFALTENMVDW